MHHRSHALAMGTTLGDIMVGLMVVLLFLITVLFILNPDPTGSPIVSIVINASLGVILLLLVGIIGMMIREGESRAI